jgi:hypothetical protein
MNTQEAINFLANKGIKVHQDGEKYFVYWTDGSLCERYIRWNERRDWHVGREIVKLAREMRDSGSIPTLGKNVKHFSNSKDRAHTRRLIDMGDFDSIPPNKRTAEEDRWSWD